MCARHTCRNASVRPCARYTRADAPSIAMRNGTVNHNLPAGRFCRASTGYSGNSGKFYGANHSAAFLRLMINDARRFYGYPVSDKLCPPTQVYLLHMSEKLLIEPADAGKQFPAAGHAGS